MAIWVCSPNTAEDSLPQPGRTLGLAPRVLDFTGVAWYCPQCGSWSKDSVGGWLLLLILLLLLLLLLNTVLKGVCAQCVGICLGGGRVKRPEPACHIQMGNIKPDLLGGVMSEVLLNGCEARDAGCAIVLFPHT